MSGTLEDRARELFFTAIDIPVERRAGFLSERCGGDGRLRAEVESLLAHDEGTGEFMDAPLMTPRNAGTAVPPAETSLPAGKRIGRYELHRVIGSGGMGMVYLAEQEQPRRCVALKVMKRGVASKTALRRFDYESQILARLRHPNIAQVYEAGTHDDGSGGVPFFAMEYIPDARTLTEYAKAKSLGTRERLALFARVCDAVHHGHQKGIIHRDLKPANILVDTEGEPKIIDFGVARSTDSDMAVTTLQTDIGQLIGTLQYMSPEQTEADPHDIDTRSDVYALGVVLYELLTGQLPYDVKTVTIVDAARMIREQRPTRPSSISRTLRGDVETITLKALEKERDRRYQSASALAEDIRRYLRNEPIVARPPSVRYQLAKFAKRNKAAVVGAAAVVVALVAGTVVSIGFALSEADQREIAEERADELQTVVSFQASMLRNVKPEAMGRSIIANLRQLLEEGLESAQAAELVAAFDRAIGTVNATNLALQTLDEHVLAPAADAIGSSFADQPLTEASLRQTLAETYRLLGLLEEGVPHQRRALEIRRRLLGDEHRATLTSISNMGMLLLQRGEQVGDLAEAGKYLRESLELRRRLLGDEHPRTLLAFHLLGFLLLQQGNFAEAEPYSRQAVDGFRRVRGDEHPRTLGAINDLSAVLQWSGRLAEAEPLRREAMVGLRRVLGDENHRTLIAINGMGFLLLQQGRLAEAEPYCREAMESRRRVLGDEHFFTRFSVNNMVELLIAQARYVQAEQLARENLPGNITMRDEDDWQTAQALSLLGEALTEQGRYEEAETHLLEGYAGLDASAPGGRRPRFLPASIERLVHLYDAWGKPEQAAEWRARLADEEGSNEQEAPR